MHDTTLQKIAPALSVLGGVIFATIIPIIIVQKKSERDKIAELGNVPVSVIEKSIEPVDTFPIIIDGDKKYYLIKKTLIGNDQIEFRGETYMIVPAN